MVTVTSTGLITQIIGPVVDVEFADGKLPKIYNALRIGEGDSSVICEVQQLLGNNKVRAVSMTSTDGLKRGIEGTDMIKELHISSRAGTRSFANRRLVYLVAIFKNIKASRRLEWSLFDFFSASDT